MVNTKDLSLTYGRGYVYKIQYHVVWCVKYRRKVLIDEVAQSLKKELLAMAQGLGVRISAMECMPDHIHPVFPEGKSLLNKLEGSPRL